MLLPRLWCLAATRLGGGGRVPILPASRYAVFQCGLDRQLQRTDEPVGREDEKSQRSKHGHPNGELARHRIEYALATARDSNRLGYADADSLDASME